jgi:hypothetical protein
VLDYQLITPEAELEGKEEEEEEEKKDKKKPE